MGETKNDIEHISDAMTQGLKKYLIDQTRGMTVKEAREFLLLENFKTLLQMFLEYSPRGPVPMRDAGIIVGTITTSELMIDFYQAMGLCETPHEVVTLFVDEQESRVKAALKQNLKKVDVE